MACIQCGAPLTADDVYCNKCGARAAAELPILADPLRAALERALGTQYDIQRLLGRGGMGAVYLARERSLDRLVAIKILPPETAADADSRERFRREARTAAKLTHPNIVPLYAFGDVDGMLYFVMGYVRGESLADRMRREGKLPADQARRILKEVADALEHAHRQGVVHRDIKPDNILLDDETGRPMLTDFGVAKARASGATLTEAGMVVGTPYYMSPEQASGARDLDGRSDLYSLGVLGYAMLAGRVPFEGEGLQDLIVQHISREPPPLEALAPEAPSDLVGAVMRCLAKEPARRWPDARTLRDAVAEEAVEDAELMPRELRVLRASAFWIIVVAPLIAGVLGAVFAVRHRPAIGLPFYLLALPLGAYLQWRIALHKGHSRDRLRRLMTSAPAWWPFWWPARWRASGDVWDRLPRLIRRLRRLRLAFWGLAYTVSLTIIGIFGVAGPWSGLGKVVAETLLLSQLVAAPLLLIGATAVAERWGKRRGLSAEEAAALLNRPTTDLAFWRTPKFAALLGPAGARKPAFAEPQSPPEHVAAIGEAVRQLADPLRDIGREAAESARQLAAAIAALDGEIGQLARDASPADLAAIEQKLAALGDAAADTDARRQMRALLGSQRDLLRKLAGQLEAATARREHLNGLLKALWLQMANLRAQAAADAVADTEISGRIRTICSEISRQASAIETVRGELP